MESFEDQEMSVLSQYYSACLDDWSMVPATNVGDSERFQVEFGVDRFPGVDSDRSPECGLCPQALSYENLPDLVAEQQESILENAGVVNASSGGVKILADDSIGGFRLVGMDHQQAVSSEPPTKVQKTGPSRFSFHNQSTTTETLAQCSPSTQEVSSRSVEPQSVAARERRKRITERVRRLEKLIPGGGKMDTASMLEEAIRYVKFLQLQVHLLEICDEDSSGSTPLILSEELQGVLYRKRCCIALESVFHK